MGSICYGDLLSSLRTTLITEYFLSTVPKYSYSRMENHEFGGRINGTVKTPCGARRPR